jgi:hypothetical protein
MILNQFFIPAALVICSLQVCSAEPSAELTTSALSPGAPRLASAGTTVDTALDPSGGPAASSATYTLKPGFVGQLYDPVELNASANPVEIGEGGSTQLAATAVMDDDTSLSLAADEVVWSVQSGPIIAVSPAGSATGGLVVGNRAAVVRGVVFGLAEDVPLTVLDSLRDNFGLVAGDGIDDAWQFEFFDADTSGILDGNEALAAAPGANPDNDLHANFFEWASGHDPKDPGSFLRFRILSKIGSDARFQLSKTIAGTTYAIERMDSLDAGALRVDVAGLTAVENAADVELMDPGALTPKGFYRLRLERDP